MLSADRERKRKLSEASISTASQHHHHQHHHHGAPAPSHAGPVDPRVLYNGLVTYTSGNSPVAPHRVRHPKGARHHHRHSSSHHEVNPQSGREYLGDTGADSTAAQTSSHLPTHDESPDRPGKRHRSHREYNLEDVLSDGELSDTGADVGEVSFDDTGERLSQRFNVFNASLASLLALVDSSPDTAFPLLDRVLGRERSSFVKTMKAMQLEGTLPWLVQSRKPAERVAPAPTIIQTTSGLLLEPLNPRPVRATSQEPTSRKVSGSGSVRSLSTSSTVPPVPFSIHTADPSVKRAKIWPPELPSIHNDSIRTQVFSHKSVVDGASSMIGEASLHNERLEFLGDSYLGAIVTRYIFTNFPDHREGPMTTIRASIISNRNLSEWCSMYKLDKHLITGGKKHAEVTGRTKGLADLFEAYIGGLLLDRGPEVVDDWIKDLIEPRMKELVEENNKEKPLNKAAKVELSGLIGGKNATIEYRWTGGGGGNQGGFCFTIFFTGWGFESEPLGSGWGSNKTDASIRAAMNVMEDGHAVRKIKLAKQNWYEHNIQNSSVVSDAVTVVRHEIA
ncbi:hypothetical protein Dda_8477 [Drechslerella dactyloides]|uniref:ribonuclease III n=1 Tax=Drechslerella dactyloides TaxID=74499 RepID=A0AAD6NFW4_DREDA|nr:hypothetical protein Dda_8477 [Drechslerella dactyloides]